jgi:hypothetical protein
MAAVKGDATNIKQGVSASGQRAVEFTLDFDGGDYTTGGLDLSVVPHSTTGVTVLNQIGLKVVTRAFTVVSAHVDNFYTLALFTASQDTVTAAEFVDLTNIKTPKLILYRAQIETPNAEPITADRQFRFMFHGS